jgi:hypothetical protein
MTRILHQDGHPQERVISQKRRENQRLKFYFSKAWYLNKPDIFFLV